MIEDRAGIRSPDEGHHQPGGVELLLRRRRARGTPAATTVYVYDAAGQMAAEYGPDSDPESGRSATGTGRLQRFRKVLVVAETVLACMLLITAGLLLHSFANLLNADYGFSPQRVGRAALIR